MAALHSDPLKLSQLRALVAVANLGNFSEAALQLGISQSAISHAIAALEEELGVILVARGRHGATLLPVGERVLHHAQAILHSIEAIRVEANLAKGLEDGTLRIASFRSVATHVLPTVIAELHDRFPGIHVEILEHQDYDGVERSLLKGDVEVGFTYLPAPPEFEVFDILHDEFIALVPPQVTVPAAGLSWPDFQGLSLIMSPVGDSCGSLVERHFAKHGYHLTPAYRMREDSTMISMVQRGLGATIMPRLAAEPIPADIQVFALPEPLMRTIGVAIVADRLQPPPVFALLDILREWRTRHPAVLSQSS